jgi:hypothetical protein
MSSGKQKAVRTVQSSSDNEMVSLAVAESDADTRLDAFLAAQIDGWSRARLQRLI